MLGGRQNFGTKRQLQQNRRALQNYNVKMSLNLMHNRYPHLQGLIMSKIRQHTLPSKHKKLPAIPSKAYRTRTQQKLSTQLKTRDTPPQSVHRSLDAKDKLASISEDNNQQAPPPPRSTSTSSSHFLQTPKSHQSDGEAVNSKTSRQHRSLTKSTTSRQRSKRLMYAQQKHSLPAVPLTPPQGCRVSRRVPDDFDVCSHQLLKSTRVLAVTNVIIYQ